MAHDDVPPTSTAEDGTAAATGGGGDAIDGGGGDRGVDDASPSASGGTSAAAATSEGDGGRDDEDPPGGPPGGDGDGEQQRKRRQPPRPPEQFRTPTLFVGGLHPRVADVHLQKLFAPYGTVHRVHRATHREGPLTGRPRGYAFVEYASSGERGGVEAARAAAGEIDGRTLLGRTLLVRPAHDRTDAGAAGEHADGTSGGAGGARSVVDSATPPDPRLVRKEKTEVQAKIDAVRKAIEERKRKRQKR